MAPLHARLHERPGLHRQPPNLPNRLAPGVNNAPLDPTSFGRPPHHRLLRSPRAPGLPLLQRPLHRHLLLDWLRPQAERIPTQTPIPPPRITFATSLLTPHAFLPKLLRFAVPNGEVRRKRGQRI